MNGNGKCWKIVSKKFEQKHIEMKRQKPPAVGCTTLHLCVSRNEKNSWQFVNYSSNLLGTLTMKMSAIRYKTHHCNVIHLPTAFFQTLLSSYCRALCSRLHGSSFFLFAKLDSKEYAVNKRFCGCIHISFFLLLLLLLTVCCILFCGIATKHYDAP